MRQKFDAIWSKYMTTSLKRPLGLTFWVVAYRTLDCMFNLCVISSYIIAQAPDVDFSKNPYADGKFKFNDQILLDEIDVGNKVCTACELN